MRASLSPGRARVVERCAPAPTAGLASFTDGHREPPVAYGSTSPASYATIAACTRLRTSSRSRTALT